MTQPETELDLDDLFDAVEASIGAAFPDLQLCEAYAADMINLPTLACIIELQELEPTDNPGTGQLAAIATLQALVLVGVYTPTGEPVRIDGIEVSNCRVVGSATAKNAATTVRAQGCWFRRGALPRIDVGR